MFFKVSLVKNYILALKRASHLLHCIIKTHHGAGLAGTKIAQQLDAKGYMIRYFVDDDIYSKENLRWLNKVFPKMELH